jgi:hypothetical protein
MEDLRIPKRRAVVEISLSGGAVRTVAVFLSEFAHEHAGAERVSDLLNRGGTFLPAMDLTTNAMTFLSHAGITVVRVDARLEEGEAEQHTIPTEHEVELTLLDGQVVRGLITYIRPPDRSRLVDYLNEAPAFLPVVEQGRLALVNVRHIAKVDAVRPA